MWCWRRMEKIKWGIDKEINEEILIKVGEKRSILDLYDVKESQIGLKKLGR